MGLPATFETGHYFCRNAEQFGDGTAALKLDNNRPTWWLRDELPWLNRSRFEETIQESLDLWRAVADVDCRRAPSEAAAKFVITTARIDGPGSVLADMQLPGPRQQFMRVDVAESALIDLVVVILCHEFGHAYGLQHFPSTPPAELMEPRLNQQVTRPQATEAALMVQWYGTPKPVVIPPVTPGTIPASFPVRISVDAYGGVYEAAGMAKRKAAALEQATHLSGEP